MKNSVKGAIIVAIFTLILASCQKEEALTPSMQDRDWYVLSDSDDPVDHLRYEIYTEYGLSIYYNDTIGSRSDGFDHQGNEVIYYEILEPNFDLGENDPVAQLKLCEDRENIRLGLEFMRDEVLSVLDKRVYPRSYLLVDDIQVDRETTYTDPEDRDNHEETTFRGMMVSVVGAMRNISTMSTDEKKLLVASIRANEWTAYIYNTKATLLRDFYAVCQELTYEHATEKDDDGVWETEDVTGSVYYEEVKTNSYNQAIYLLLKPLEEYGFLKHYPDRDVSYDSAGNLTVYFTPTEILDLTAYLEAYFYYTEAEFEAKYGEYDLVMRKYELIKAVLAELM